MYVTVSSNTATFEALFCNNATLCAVSVTLVKSPSFAIAVWEILISASAAAPWPPAAAPDVLANTGALPRPKSPYTVALTVCGNVTSPPANAGVKDDADTVPLAVPVETKFTICARYSYAATVAAF